LGIDLYQSGDVFSARATLVSARRAERTGRDAHAATIAMDQRVEAPMNDRDSRALRV
jgi:hypothetical protein